MSRIGFPATASSHSFSVSGATTRVTTDTLAPTWAGRVPAGVGQFRAGQGDISSDAMQFRHDSVIVFAPIPPGGVKQISYAYSLPAGTRALVLPIDQPTTEVNLLVEDTAAVVTAPKIESFGIKEIACLMNFGGPEPEAVERSMRLFGEKVMPRVSV